MSKSFGRIRRGFAEAQAHLEGRPTKVRVTEITVTSEDVRAVRRGLKLTQREFATLVGMSIAGLRKVEQGQQQMHGALATLIQVMRREPGAVLRAIRRPLDQPRPTEERKRA